MHAYFANPELFEAFKLGVVVGMGGGVVLYAALTVLFIYHWAGRCYERGVQDARKGWRGRNLDGQGDHMKLERTGKKYPRTNGVWFACECCGAKFYRSAYWKGKLVRWCSWECRYPEVVA